MQTAPFEGTVRTLTVVSGRVPWGWRRGTLPLSYERGRRIEGMEIIDKYLQRQGGQIVPRFGWMSSPPSKWRIAANVQLTG